MHDQATPTRRQFLGSALGLIGAGLVGGSAVGSVVGSLGNAERVAALSGSVTGAATATEPAVRLRFAGKLTFPVDTDPAYGSLVCLNNFGGRSQAFGACNHKGVDIGNDQVSGKGRPLLACVDGVIEKDEYLTYAGNTRILRDGTGTFYRYHHLDRYDSTLQAGDTVVAGQVIGYMGNSGRNVNWNHLHFEIWIGSLTPRLATIIDPVPRLPFPQSNVRLEAPTACSV